MSTSQPAGSEPGLIRTWVARSLDEMPAIYSVRHEVFVVEQGLTHTVVDEPDDRYSVHVLAAIGAQIVGVGRVTFIGDEAQIAWVAVRRAYRRHGVGRAIMDLLLEVSREQTSLVSLNAQTHALHFYESLGFRPVGRRFHMAQIEHQHMVMELPPAGQQ